MASQNQRILSHLKRGRAITQMQALKLYNCFRLAARIEQLRRLGHSITTTPITRGDKTFASYSLRGVKK